MSKASTLKALPPAVLAQVNFLIGDGGWTIDQIVDYLSEAGHPRSRSAVGRHAQRINAVAEKLRQSREITEAVVKEMGPAAADGRQGRFLVEVLRNLVGETLMRRVTAGGEEDAFDAEGFMLLAKALKDMSAATRYDQDFDLKSRKAHAEEVARIAKEQAESAASEATNRGMSDDQVDFIRAKILGVKLPTEAR
ncbi:phage protein Gp27 family protein [Nitrospirillum amazonense]|uniref:phage protein Gp27 family protein n=1 Tax=Nitrospirillum amazonense TaxID=28077 RepID=UPI002412A31B|nr:phage protein Gp27 family protein [Nitrospirillum amazonense]MDG3442460.1 DUF3486 family protein [Nitrospirillum amazonense]